MSDSTTALASAIDDLLKRPKTDAGRLNAFADYCIEGFARHGLVGVRGGASNEINVPGLTRSKDWDLAFMFAGKPRLLLSLKSMLKNLSGAVPNRLDDLMGEAANVQQISPEVVIGYAIVMDVAEDSTRRDGDTWINWFEKALGRVAIRNAPLWNQGLIESFWVLRIDSREPPGARLVSPDVAAGEAFFGTLVDRLRQREPAIFITPP